MTFGDGLRWIYFILMRDLNMRFDDISNLTYPQIYMLVKCLHEANKAASKQMDYNKTLMFMKSRGR